MLVLSDQLLVERHPHIEEFRIEENEDEAVSAANSVGRVAHNSTVLRRV